MQLDGIGFQAHIGGFPNSIYDVYGTLEDFYQTFGTKAKVTEYDTNEAISDELAATYLRDFMTIVFSHQSTDGFLMWGFWDGAHWHDNAPLFYQDWTIKPAGEAFIDLVFDEWWTEDSGQTDANGAFDVRGFKGTYKITIDCGNEVLVDTIQLRNDMLIVKSEGQIVTDLDEDLLTQQVRIFPNPASDFLSIENADGSPIQIYIFDSKGSQVYSNKVSTSHAVVPLEFGKGAFEIVVESNGRKTSKTILVQ
ncbi:MAG: hypothetical protein DHS20C17_36180 [Cyclobacteriaceae bacterium]|nr:MAG: hypothetical protein DHS20C17_36180 [Cyclobacteriaceae bacterium]